MSFVQEKMIDPLIDPLTGKDAEKAAEVQAQSLREGREQQLDMFYQAREDLVPWRSTGLEALNAQRQYLGLSPLEAPIATTREGKTLADLEGQIATLQKEIDSAGQAPTGAKRSEISDLQAQAESLREQQKPYQTIDVQKDLESTPGYQFQVGEGLKALERQLGPAGASGRAMKAIQRFGQGLANNTFTQRLQQLANLASSGQNAASQQAGQAYDMGGNLLNISSAIGNAIGTGMIQRGNAVRNLINQGAQAVGAMYGIPPTGGSSTSIQPSGNFNFANPFQAQPKYDQTSTGTYNIGW